MEPDNNTEGSERAKVSGARRLILFGAMFGAFAFTALSGFMTIRTANIHLTFQLMGGVLAGFLLGPLWGAVSQVFTIPFFFLHAGENAVQLSGYAAGPVIAATIAGIMETRPSYSRRSRYLWTGIIFIPIAIAAYLNPGVRFFLALPAASLSVIVLAMFRSGPSAEMFWKLIPAVALSLAAGLFVMKVVPPDEDVFWWLWYGYLCRLPVDLLQLLVMSRVRHNLPFQRWRDYLLKQ